jgi:TonB family protein
MAVVLSMVRIASAQDAEYFQERLRAGREAFGHQRYREATEDLRVASFGLLESPPLLSEALVRLAISEETVGEGTRVDATLARFLDLETRFPSYASAALEPATRRSFEALLARRVSSDKLRAVPSLRNAPATVIPMPTPSSETVPEAAPPAEPVPPSTTPVPSTPPATSTSSPTSRAISSPSPTATVTQTPTSSPTPAPTAPPTATATPTNSATHTATATPTGVPPRATSVPPTQTRTPTATRTRTPSPTATRTATATRVPPTATPAAPPRVVALESVDRRPRVVKMVPPVYPRDALRARLRGLVVLRVLVSETGVPLEIQVVQPARGGLTEAAVEAVRQWRFEPALYGRTAVRTWAPVRIPFEAVPFAQSTPTPVPR